jgi:hypothetical protein
MGARILAELAATLLFAAMAAAGWAVEASWSPRRDLRRLRGALPDGDLTGRR